MTTGDEPTIDSGDAVVSEIAAEPRPAEPDAGPEPAPPSRDDAWIELLSDGDALNRRRDLFDDAFAAVVTTVKIDPRASETVSRVIERRLASVRIDASLGEVTDALRTYVGVDAAYLVHWLVYANTVDRLAQVDAAAPEEVSYFFRRLLAEHGARIDLAQRAALLGPDDWVHVSKNAYYDVLTGRYLFSLSVLKLDDSTLRLECTADSMLRLTSHLLELVNSVSAASVYGSSVLDLFVGTLTQTAQLVGLDVPDASGEEHLRGGNRIEQDLETQEEEATHGDLE